MLLYNKKKIIKKKYKEKIIEIKKTIKTIQEVDYVATSNAYKYTHKHTNRHAHLKENKILKISCIFLYMYFFHVMLQQFH